MYSNLRLCTAASQLLCEPLGCDCVEKSGTKRMNDCNEFWIDRSIDVVASMFVRMRIEVGILSYRYSSSDP